MLVKITNLDKMPKYVGPRNMKVMPGETVEVHYNKSLSPWLKRQVAEGTMAYEVINLNPPNPEPPEDLAQI